MRWDPSEYGGLDRMVQKEFRDTIWTPDTFFVNSKGDVQDGSWAPSRETFVRILHSGEVLVSDRCGTIRILNNVFSDYKNLKN